MVYLKSDIPHVFLLCLEGPCDNYPLFLIIRSGEFPEFCAVSVAGVAISGVLRSESLAEVWEAQMNLHSLQAPKFLFMSSESVSFRSLMSPRISEHMLSLSQFSAHVKYNVSFVETPRRSFLSPLFLWRHYCTKTLCLINPVASGFQ